MFEPSKLTFLLENKYLCELPSPLGPLYILGAVGRRRLGLSPFYKSPPEAAASQVVRRRVRKTLEAQQWHFVSKSRYNLHVFEREHRIYSAAKYEEYSARTVRRLITAMKPRLIQESSYLLVWTERPYRLAPLRKNAYPLLHVSDLPKG